MKERKEDLSMELYIIDYVSAFILMLGGFVFLLASHTENMLTPRLFSALLCLIQ